MDVLGDSMRRATESAPPTGIDLAALIAGERRRHRRLTAGAAVLAAAAVVAGLVVAVPYAGGGMVGVGPGPTNECALRDTRTETPTPPWLLPTSPAAGDLAPLRPRPTEPAGAAEQRLSIAFEAALRAAAPAMTFADISRPGCPWAQFQNFGPQFWYEAMVLATDSGGTGGIAVSLYLRPAGRPPCDSSSCSYNWIEDLPDGSIAWGYDDADHFGAHLWRPDGTAVFVQSITTTLRAEVPRTTPPIDRAQMIAIGTFPAMTLYP